MTRKPDPSDWHFGFVAGASDGGSSKPPSRISDTGAYLAGFADGQVARAHALPTAWDAGNLVASRTSGSLRD